MGLIIFGLKDLASLAHFYMRDAVAFTVDNAYYEDTHFEGLPVIPFEELDPTHEILLPISDNKIRAEKSFVAKKRGLKLASYVHPSTVYYGGIGENCFILEKNVIQPFVKIGDNAILWTMNHIGHHSVIGNNVFIASGIIVCGHCVIEDYAYLGANCTIRDGKRVGRGCIVGMDSAVTDDLDEWSTYYGVPARKKVK